MGGAVQIAGCGDGAVTQMTSERRAPRPVSTERSVLVLGGTGFVGPPIVRRALDAGFAVTLFNRGRTNAELFPDLELLIGDRDGDLDSLADAVAAKRKWDAVIDLSGYGADHVAATARLLAPAAEQYVFVSSVAVYASFAEPNDEMSPVHTSRSGDYGPQKAWAEREAEAAMPGRVTALRPTYIAGPGDNTDRFTYWPARAARGGEMLVPGPQDRPVQFVDVRDVALLALQAVERRLVGAYNAVIPAGDYTMAGLLGDCEAAARADVVPVWVSPEFAERRIGGENELPIWESPLGRRRSFPLISGARAAAAGWTTRAPLETVRDTLQWWQALPQPRRLGSRAGLTAEREQALLAEWRRQAP
jgi:2'-hydroxyisoflavone reductase